MSFPNDRVYTRDANLQFSDNAAAYTATGYLQVGGAQAIIDLQGNQGTSPTQQPRGEWVAEINVTAIDIASGNETYTLYVVVSNSPSFASGNVVAGAIQMGKGSSLSILGAADSVIGTYEVMFTNNIAGSIYEYATFYLVCGGTTPSISIEGGLAVLPEV
jgi:hypothetical protein